MSVISQLKHPNIVEWLEQGMTRGQFWFAMEYVAGTNLEALANADPGQYPIDQACRMACQILKGLEHAHALGFVHRDIKPENILIGRRPTGLVAKISDFGLAKSFRGIGLSGLTFSGEMRGTIPFMPPEQMLDFKTVLPSADLYATAATLYYLLSGQFIYDQVDEGGDLIRTLLEEPPVPIREPPARRPRRSSPPSSRSASPASPPTDSPRPTRCAGRSALLLRSSRTPTDRCECRNIIDRASADIVRSNEELTTAGRLVFAHYCCTRTLKRFRYLSSCPESALGRKRGGAGVPFRQLGLPAAAGSNVSCRGRISPW